MAYGFESSHCLFLNFGMADVRAPGGAELFLFDPGNPFVEFVVDDLGYEPENLRKRIRESGVPETVKERRTTDLARQNTGRNGEYEP
jgi:hypothetical protein